MSDAGVGFDYVALDAAGRRVKGHVDAASELEAFAMLKADQVSPLVIKPGRAKAGSQTGAKGLPAAELEILLGDLAVLLRAGADIRSALSILGERASSPRLAAACQRISIALSGGEALEAVLTREVQKGELAIPALLAAAEAGGDLAQGLERAAEVLKNRRSIAEQLIGALSYPAFILLSTLGATLLILLVVIPSLEPLVEGAGTKAAPILAALLAVSSALRDNGLVIVIFLTATAAGIFVLGRLGLLDRPVQRLALDGPVRSITRGLLLGGFARALGSLLASGAPMAEALRLAVRTTPWTEARDRLSPVLGRVRQGEALSSVLSDVNGLPISIARLSAVGEASGALGEMLMRAGAFEEAQALKRIEAVSKLLGPMLIVVLGLMIGGLMAALLSGVTSLGETALH